MVIIQLVISGFGICSDRYVIVHVKDPRLLVLRAKLFVDEQNTRC